MKKFNGFCLLMVLLIFGNPSFAQTEEEEVIPVTPFKLLLGIALELGGDDVDEIFFTNGESQSVRTAQGISIALGTRMQIPSVRHFALDATVGFKYVTTQADNAHIRLSRIPLHLIGHWMISDDFSLGVGAISHQNIKYKSDGISQDISFKNALGSQFQFAYKGVGLHFTKMNYTDQFGQGYKADAFGLSYYGTIPGA